MARFDAVDLSKLPAPAVVEQLDFESYLTAFKADFIVRAAEAGWDYDVDALESDPVVKVLEVAAYRETLLRGVVNDKARAVMLAHALGSDLDNLGGLYKVGRATDEDHERLRSRIQGAPEALSTCGPEGAYVHHAKRASPSVKDVWVYTVQGTGQVHVLPLVSTGDGTPDSPLLDAVREACRADDKRPLTDIVIVRAPTVTSYAISLSLLVKRGPDAALIANAAKARVEAYVASRHRVAETHYLSGIIAAATVGGVETVTPVTPAADKVPAIDEAFWCSGVTISVEVV